MTFVDLAHHETRLIAANAARWIEYPTAHLALGNRDWSLPLVLRGVALGVLGLVVAVAVQRLRRLPRPHSTAAATSVRRSQSVS